MKGVHFLTSTVAILAFTSPLQAVFVNGKFCEDPNKSSWFNRDSRECRPNSRTEHSWHFPSSHRLRTKWPKPSHTHPCGSEILVVLEGTLYVGFITSNADNNRLISKLLNKGDVFVFPIGLIHFQLNVGYGNAVAFAGLSSQNPGVITIANAVFGSKPPIDLDVLAKAFQVDNKLVDYLQKQF
ncbi:unnamed protein product [Prunus armeniaca]|uniref:Germin-like protein n=1 Tax=Prunus armeniaca TaxID=36596 RepID=A0A6J5VJZ6_PRUAR|nr:unnamed protein product [Prunus armeniaca]CAB4319618.1 unnamed protein product [Prunus armeniaca]